VPSCGNGIVENDNGLTDGVNGSNTLGFLNGEACENPFKCHASQYYEAPPTIVQCTGSNPMTNLEESYCKNTIVF
jgi:hypothetical protein